MFVLDRLLVSGIAFVLDKIAYAADAEVSDPDRLREELLAAQMELEMGAIDEAEFGRLEAAIMERMRQVRQGQIDQSGAVAGAGAVVELSESGDWHEEREPTRR